MENTSTETLEVKYFLLEKDNTRTMKLFLEFEKFKEELAVPNKNTGAMVVVKESEVELAKQFFFQNNYYSFSIYKKCLPNRDNKEFTFSDCVLLYDFNDFLRENLMKFTGKIEQLIKSSIVHSLCSYYEGELQKGECYLDSSIYVNKSECEATIKRMGQSLYSNKSKSLPIRHHIDNKNYKFPIWVIIPELTFGETTKFIEKLNKDYYEFWIEELFIVKDKFNVPSLRDHIISSARSWISASWYIRNVCAHYGRLYGCNFNTGVPTFYAEDLRKLKAVEKKKRDNKDLFAYMIAIKNLLICHSEQVQLDWNNFVCDLEIKISSSQIIERKKIGFPEKWKEYLIISVSTGES